MQDLENKFVTSGGNDTESGPNLAALALAEAINRARAAQAERDSFSRDTRAVSISRLEGLRKKLQPLYAAIPRDVEMFDLGLVPNERPRLFVDVIAYVEMSKDQKIYRFLQETRSGRVTLAESEDPQRIVDRVTDYIAERLVERERALASDSALDRRLPPPSLDASVLPTQARDLRPAVPEPVVLTPAAPVSVSTAVPVSNPVPMQEFNSTASTNINPAAPPAAVAAARGAVPSPIGDDITLAADVINGAWEKLGDKSGTIAATFEPPAAAVKQTVSDLKDSVVAAAGLAAAKVEPAVSAPVKATAAYAQGAVSDAVSRREEPAGPGGWVSTAAAAGSGAALAAQRAPGGLSWFWAMLFMVLAAAFGAWLAYIVLSRTL